MDAARNPAGRGRSHPALGAATGPRSSGAPSERKRRLPQAPRRSRQSRRRRISLGQSLGQLRPSRRYAVVVVSGGICTRMPRANLSVLAADVVARGADTPSPQGRSPRCWAYRIGLGPRCASHSLSLRRSSWSGARGAAPSYAVAPEHREFARRQPAWRRRRRPRVVVVAATEALQAQVANPPSWSDDNPSCSIRILDGGCVLSALTHWGWQIEPDNFEHPAEDSKPANFDGPTPVRPIVVAQLRARCCPRLVVGGPSDDGSSWRAPPLGW